VLCIKPDTPVLLRLGAQTDRVNSGGPKRTLVQSAAKDGYEPKVFNAAARMNVGFAKFESCSGVELVLITVLALATMFWNTHRSRRTRLHILGVRACIGVFG
jgi:hypothetical protein